jgi:hypothetical protein
MSGEGGVSRVGKFNRSKWGEQRKFLISVCSVASCEKVTVTIEGRVSTEKEG